MVGAVLGIMLLCLQCGLNIAFVFRKLVVPRDPLVGVLGRCDGLEGSLCIPVVFFFHTSLSSWFVKTPVCLNHSHTSVP